MGGVRPRRLMVLLIVVGAALAYRQYRLSQVADPAVGYRSNWCRPSVARASLISWTCDSSRGR